MMGTKQINGDDIPEDCVRTVDAGIAYYRKLLTRRLYLPAESCGIVLKVLKAEAGGSVFPFVSMRVV